MENRILPVPADLPPSSLIEASNYLNARVRGRTLAQVREEIEISRSAAQSELDVLTARLVTQVWRDGRVRRRERKISSCVARPICSKI